MTIPSLHQKNGLVPLMGILGLPNLPIDFPTHQACTSVGGVAKSVLNLAHEPQVLKQGLLHLDEVLRRLAPLHRPMEEPGGSVLLHELVSAPVLSEATSNPQVTPLLHDMSAAHAYIQVIFLLHAHLRFYFSSAFFSTILRQQT